MKTTKTTAQIASEALTGSANLASLEECKRAFSTANIAMIDRICGRIADAVKNLKDPENAVWFTRKRMEMIPQRIAGMTGRQA